MEGRKRTVQVKFYVTEEERRLIREKMKLIPTRNMAAYTAAALRPMREVFCHAKTVHFFRLGSGGIKASCTFGSAKYPGIRGNALRVVITASEGSTEQAPRYDVETFLDTQKVETQEGISTAAELADNDFVVWKDDAVLALTASTPLTGGTNGTVEDGNYQTFLDAIESRTFNALGCTSTNDTIKKLFAAFTERMRNDVGKKFQCIGFRYLADDEGVISLKNTVTDEGADPAALIPWVVGVAAGTAVNKSATNMVYRYSIGGWKKCHLCCDGECGRACGGEYEPLPGRGSGLPAAHSKDLHPCRC